MIETYISKLNPRAQEKYHTLPFDVREDVEQKWNRHRIACLKCGMGPDRGWLIEAIESATKGENYDRRATREGDR